VREQVHLFKEIRGHLSIFERISGYFRKYFCTLEVTKFKIKFWSKSRSNVAEGTELKVTLWGQVQEKTLLFCKRQEKCNLQRQIWGPSEMLERLLTQSQGVVEGLNQDIKERQADVGFGLLL
jgi:hypothetical protein